MAPAVRFLLDNQTVNQDNKGMNDLRTKREKWFILILMTVFLIQGTLGLSASVYAADETDDSLASIMQDSLEQAAEIGNVVLFEEKDRPSAVQLIRYPFLDTKTVTYEWNFPYTDDFFRRPSNKFSITLAQASLGLALSAFRSTANVTEPQYESYLRGAGFTDLYAFGYDQPTTENSLSGVIGMKKIRDFTVIAAVTCGQGYQNEWAGNMRVGKGERHEGFNIAAGLLKEHLQQYIRDHNVEGSKKLWLTGMSRAAAVANLTAADMIESGEYDDVYAYLFGVPRTTKAPVRYSGIYNICGQYDPVPSTPLQSWGFERYGVDLYTPAQEADSDYTYFAGMATNVSSRLEHKPFRNNPEVNYQFRLIMESLGVFFESSDEYADRFQDLLIDAMEDHNYENLRLILNEAMKEFEPEDDTERRAKTIFIDYLSYMAGQHTRADQRQIADGSWQADEPLAANLMLEHRPSTYVKWLFSSVDPPELLTSCTKSRHIIFSGKYGITVMKGDAVACSIDANGKIEDPDQIIDDSGNFQPIVYMKKNGQDVSIFLPDDEEYSIIVDSPSGGRITYCSYILTPEDLHTESDDYHFGQMTAGSYRIDITPGKPLPDPEAEEGYYIDLGSTEQSYWPITEMSLEMSANGYRYMTLSGIFRIVVLVLIIFTVQNLLCIVLYFTHRRGIKKGHPPYSDWYVIVPHIVSIAIFAFLTQYVSFFLFTISKARAECAAVTVFLIFLLALRGTLRNRSLKNVIVSVMLLILACLTGLYYNKLPIDVFSRTNMLLFFAAIVLLTMAAINTFKKPSEDSVDD